MTENNTPKYRLYQNTGFMVSTAWRVRRSVIFLVMLLAVLAAANTAAQLFAAPMILRKVETLAPLPELLTVIGVFGAGLPVLSGLEAYVRQNALFGRIAVRQDIVLQLEHKAARTSYPNTMRADFQSFQEKSYRACYDNRSAAEGFWNTLTELLSNGLSFLLWVVLLSGLNPLLLCVIGITCGAGYGLGRVVGGWGWRHRRKEGECHRKMAYIRRAATGRLYAKDIRSFGLRPWLEQVWDNGFFQYRKFLGQRARVYMGGDFGEAALAFARGGVIFSYLLWLTQKEGMGVSEFFLYFTAANGFTVWITGILDNLSLLHRQSLELSVIREFLEWPEEFAFEEGKPLAKEAGKGYELRLADLMNVFGRMRSNGSFLERTYEFLDIPNTMYRGSLTTEKRSDRKYEVEFRDVSFRYPGTEEYVLRHVNMKFPVGSRLAVVGMNGSGKTTFIKLLCRLYDPSEGEILLNGIDVRKYRDEDYRRLFSVVFQDFQLFSLPLGENIARGREYDPGRARECLEKAGFGDWTRVFGRGMDTWLYGDLDEAGVLVSGGEAQKIAIARALYKDAPFMVLDEPTAALDPVAEAEIYERLHDIAGDRTAVYISHRLASCKFCDRIAVFHQGEMVQMGSHEELMADKGGMHERLWGAQAGYYQ